MLQSTAKAELENRLAIDRLEAEDRWRIALTALAPHDDIDTAATKCDDISSFSNALCAKSSASEREPTSARKKAAKRPCCDKNSCRRCRARLPLGAGGVCCSSPGRSP